MVKLEEFKEQIRKKIECLQYRFNILETLLYFSALEDNKIPNIGRFVFNEVARGAVEYVTGKESKFEPPTYLIDENGKKKYSTRSDNFEPNMFKHFKDETNKGKRKLNDDVMEALFLMLKPEWISDDYGYYDGYVPELYTHFRRFMAPLDSVVDLPRQIKEDTEEFLPTLSEEVIENLEGIGKAMRRYKNKDIEYIKEHYHY